MRNTLKMAELTYAELTQGRESTRLPHMHKLTSLKQKSFLVRKLPLSGPKCPVTLDACFRDLHKILFFCHFKI